MIDCVIFDMDGVLVDAREWHYRALNQALQFFGFEISENDHFTTFDGLPTRTKLKILTEHSGLPSGLHSIISDLKQEYTLREAYLHCRPEFSIINTLVTLRDYGVRLGCASNSVRESVRTFLMRSEILHFFSTVLSNEDVVNPKPNPEIYLLAMNELQSSPPRTLIVEDNDHGRIAAQSSGAHVLMVNSPSDVSADLLMNHIRSISESNRD